MPLSQLRMAPSTTVELITIQRAREKVLSTTVELITSHRAHEKVLSPPP